MGIAELRAKALAYTATLEYRYRVCVDPAAAKTIADAVEAASRPAPAPTDGVPKNPAGARRKIGDQPTTVPATDLVETAWATAADSTLVAVFGMLDPTDYMAHEMAATDKAGMVSLAQLSATLPRAAYTRTETATGEDMQVPTWDEAVHLYMRHADDLVTIARDLMGMHRSPVAGPFAPASCGAPATN